MAWFKVDDKLHSHKKAARAGADALGLWVLAGSWSADHLTDGFVPDYIALRLDSDAEAKADKLVKAGLWERGERDGDQGWTFNDWPDYQPMREDVERERADARDRMRKRRRDKGGKFAGSSGEQQENFGRSSADVRPPRPDPTRPVVPNGTTSASTDVDAAFASFWVTYPRKVAKGAAKRAYRTAVKKAEPHVIEEALRSQLGWFQMQVRTDGDYRPHASTWLNQERWTDEPSKQAAASGDDGLWGRLRGSA